MYVPWKQTCVYSKQAWTLRQTENLIVPDIFLRVSQSMTSREVDYDLSKQAIPCHTKK